MLGRRAPGGNIALVERDTATVTMWATVFVLSDTAVGDNIFSDNAGDNVFMIKIHYSPFNCTASVPHAMQPPPAFIKCSTRLP